MSFRLLLLYATPLWTFIINIQYSQIDIILLQKILICCNMQPLNADYLLRSFWLKDCSVLRREKWIVTEEERTGEPYAAFAPI